MCGVLMIFIFAGNGPGGQVGMHIWRRSVFGCVPVKRCKFTKKMVQHVDTLWYNGM